MKFRPSVILLFIAVAVAGMSSCTKQYTCQCGITYTGNAGLPDSTTTSFNITDTKSNAKSSCTAQSGDYYNTTDPDQGQIHTRENCVLY